MKTSLLFLVSIGTAFASLPSFADQTVTAEIARLHPTQFSLGMIEVRERETKFEQMSPQKLAKYMHKNPLLAVVGPGGEYYVTDHHHLGRALEDIGVQTTELSIQADWSNLSVTDFWSQMQEKNWVYLEDAQGVQHTSPLELPHTLDEMQDDIYRSIAWKVRKAGGYQQTTVLYADFKWADFFRARVTAAPDGSDFDEAVKQALKLAHSQEAQNLPGYSPN